jgi:hypothetical protein
VLTSMCVDRFFLRIEEKTLPLHGGCRWSPPTWPLRACTASPPGRRRTSLFHGAPRKTRWDGSSSSLRNLTLLAGLADNTEEDGCGRGREASSLQNLPRESQAIPTTETRL